MDAHAELYAQGWKYQLSFYGTLLESGWTCRIEVVSQTPFSRSQIENLYRFFDHFTPRYGYLLVALTQDGLKEIVPRGLGH